jgi:hypothetical protein
MQKSAASTSKRCWPLPTWPTIPGFPVMLGGINKLHAAFFTESRTRDYEWCGVQEIRVKLFWSERRS